MNSSNKKIAVFIVLLLIFPTLVSFLFPDIRNYLMLLAFNIVMFASMGLAWYIIGGMGRQISWAHAAYFAVGAYATMVTYQLFRLSPWAGILIGMVVAALLALVIGIASFKLHGVFFSLATIAFGQIFFRLLYYFGDITGGASGLVMPKWTQSSIGNLQFINNDYYYYLIILVFLLIFVICKIIEKSRLGYSLRAVRENEIAAESMGIKPYDVKMKAFIISAILISIIGAIFTLRFKFIDPDTVASHDLSIRIGMTVIVGGMGFIEGPIIGALIMVPLLELTSAYFGNILNGGLSQTLYGVVLVLIVIFMPDGVLHLIKSRKFWKKHGKDSVS